MVLTIFIYIFNEILFIIYDIIMLIVEVENYIDLVAFVNNNENENF